MRYLVHRGTGTIIDPLDDLVIVDIDDSFEQDEGDILELAECAPTWNKAVIGTYYELLSVVEQLQENLLCYLDGMSDEILNEVCQIVIDTLR